MKWKYSFNNHWTTADSSMFKSRAALILPITLQLCTASVISTVLYNATLHVNTPSPTNFTPYTTLWGYRPDQCDPPVSVSLQTQSRRSSTAVQWCLNWSRTSLHWSRYGRMQREKSRNCLQSQTINQTVKLYICTFHICIVGRFFLLWFASPSTTF